MTNSIQIPHSFFRENKVTVDKPYLCLIFQKYNYLDIKVEFYLDEARASIQNSMSEKTYYYDSMQIQPLNLGEAYQGILIHQKFSPQKPLLSCLSVLVFSIFDSNSVQKENVVSAHVLVQKLTNPKARNSMTDF